MLKFTETKPFTIPGRGKVFVLDAPEDATSFEEWYPEIEVGDKVFKVRGIEYGRKLLYPPDQCVVRKGDSVGVLVSST